MAIEWGDLGDNAYAVRYQGAVYRPVNGRWKRDDAAARRVDRFEPAPAWVVEHFMAENDTLDFGGDCQKCRGTGKTRFKHVAGGICFTCEGTGKVRSRRHPGRGR